MAVNTTDVTRGAQQQILESIEQTQKAALEGFRTWTDAFEKMIPDTPTAKFWNDWPSVEESIDSAYDFAGKVLDNQRKFTKNVLQATRPVVDRVADEAPVAPKRSSSKRSSSKRSSASK
ncbi:MAG: hypothetical protein M3454_12500 [Actinomycetota bacterium]|nr:hypothetical protein [Actinomycetota bacterium]